MRTDHFSGGIRGGALPPEVGLPRGEVGTLPPLPREQND